MGEGDVQGKDLGHMRRGQGIAQGPKGVAGEPCGEEHRWHNRTEQSSAVYRTEQDGTRIEQDRTGGQNRTGTERERAVNRTQQEEESQRGSRQYTHGRTVNRTPQDRTSHSCITHNRERQGTASHKGVAGAVSLKNYSNVDSVD